MIKTVMLYETGDGVRYDTVDKAVLADRTMAVESFLSSQSRMLNLPLAEINRIASIIATSFAGLLPILQKDFKEGFHNGGVVGNRPGLDNWHDRGKPIDPPSGGSGRKMPPPQEHRVVFDALNAPAGTIFVTDEAGIPVRKTPDEVARMILVLQRSQRATDPGVSFKTEA